MTDLEAAWNEIHDARPECWFVGPPTYVEHRKAWEQYPFDTRERANYEATRPAILDGVGHAAADRPLPCMTDIAVQDASAVATTVRLAAEGNEVAFARLVSEHHAAMARVAYVIVGDAEQTRDVVQSAWSIAWRRLHTLRDPGHVRAWLVAIAANEARHAVRRERRTTIVDISEALDRHGSNDPADLISLVDLERALRKLGPDDRALIAMRFVAGLDSTEIAAQLGISASGIRSRLARLLDHLRADLEPTDGSRR